MQTAPGSLHNSSSAERNESGTYDTADDLVLIFRAPIDLAEVTAVRIGETVIPVAP